MIIMDNEYLKQKALQMLLDVGMEIQSEQLVAAMLAKGCKELPSGRIQIPTELVDELVASQELTQAEDDDTQRLHPFCGIDWTHWIVWTGQKERIKERLETEFLMSAFDCGPTNYYDYQARTARPVNTDIFIEMKKFAQATPEIGYISTWYRQDVPGATERIASLILALQYTDKVDGIEAINPAGIKYLVEIGEIMSGRPKDRRYLAGSECIISPLVFEKRSADDTVERARLGVSEYHITSMATMGVNFPVTPAAAVVTSAAEIIGGMVAAYCIDPQAEITGRMIATYMDMRTADTTAVNPESITVDLAVKQLFDECFGGHLWTEVLFSPSASEPGLLPVYQNWYGAASRAFLTGDPSAPYPGMGTLHNGSTGSPTQFMLDMEIRKSQFFVKKHIVTNDETVPYAEMVERINNNQHFLQSDHTMAHWRELWNSDLLPLTVPAAAGDVGKEQAILDKCENMWRANVATWEPPDIDDDKMKALNGVLKRAEQELM